MKKVSEDVGSGLRISNNAQVASGTRRRCFCLGRAVFLVGFLLSVTAIRADETNAVSQGLCVEDGSTITNAAQFAAFDQPGLTYPVIWPYEPQGMFEGQQVWWADFDQLPQELSAIRGSSDYEFHGVKFSALTLILDAATGAVTVKYPFSDTVLLQLDAPADYQPFQKYNQELEKWCQGSGRSPATFAELISDGSNYFLDPPQLVLEVWVGSSADCALYESNVAAELAEWAEEDAMTAEPETAGRGGDAAPRTASAAGGRGMMLMESGASCVITNEADPFAVSSIDRDGDGFTTVTWQSCSDHMYGVYTTEEMSFTNVWTAQQWLLGEDGATSWTDTNAPAFQARFYRVERLTLDGDEDGDGQSNLDECLAGTDPHDPTDFFHITNIVWAGNDMWVYFTSVSGKYYTLQRGYCFGGEWTNVVENIPGNGGIQWVKDIGGGLLSLQCYRVALQLGSPPPPDSDYDGIPDWWTQQYFGHPTGLAADLSRAADDADGDGLTNLDEYLQGTDPTDPDIAPPSITATVIPSPNTAGWNNINVTVHFTASDESGIRSVSPDVTITNEGSDYEITGIAVDNAGNTAETTVFVNIDKTPPTFSLDPGTGTVLDLSQPLLVVKYADPEGADVPPDGSSGLDMDSLQITIDGADVKASFYRTHRGAVAVATNLSAGVHSWSCQIADMAGNVMSNTIDFTATGEINTNAPSLSGINLSHDVTVIPDVAEVWVQSTVTNAGATVTASVNFGESIPLNARGNDFGYLLSVEPGTNIVVLVAADATGQNLSSRLFQIVRTDAFRAAITAPALGSFAEGQSNTVCGYVSAKIDEGLTTEADLVSVTVNGATALLGNVDSDGNIAFTNSTTLSPGPGSVAITGQITWSDGRVSDLPPSYQDDYEVVSRTEIDDSVYRSAEDTPAQRPTSLCDNQWRVTHMREDITTNVYAQVGSMNMHVDTHLKTRNLNLGCASSLDLDSWPWGDWNAYEYDSSSQVAARSLAFGNSSSSNHIAYVGESVVPYRTSTEASLTFRAPWHYGTNTAVVFSFTNMWYATGSNDEQTASDLGAVKFIFGGQTNLPVSVDNVGRTASYVITVDGGKRYTVDQNNFQWPGCSTNHTYTSSINGHTYTDTYFKTNHWFSFDGFHSDPIEVVVKKQGTDKAPDGGLLVKTGDMLEIVLEPADTLTNSSVAWQTRQLKSDGSLTTWANYGSGVKLDKTTTQGGIFQLKATVTTGADRHEFVYVRKHDDAYGPSKKGDTDAVGVADTDTQIAIRNAAKGKLGSTDYSAGGSLPLWRDPLRLFTQRNKCNVFVADVCDEAGANVDPPVLGVYLTHPPSANNWAGMPDVNDSRAPYPIPNWTLLADDAAPQPGYVCASGFESAAPGHSGIVDYDGHWVSAGPDNVNRKADFSHYKRQYVSGAMKPAGQRKYSGN